MSVLERYLTDPHYWARDERRPGIDGPRVYAKRRFLHWGPEDKRRDVHLDVYANRPGGHGWGFQVRLDGPHAETPIDAGLFLGRWLYVFAGTSLGRRLCQLARVQGYPTGSRQVSFAVQRLDGAPLAGLVIKWCLWVDPEHQTFGRWQRDKMRAARGPVRTWLYAHVRRGYWHPFGDLANLVFGRTAYTVDEGDTITVSASLPEGDYPLTLTLERATWKRPRSRRKRTRVSVDIRVVPTAEGGPGYAPTGKTSYGSDDGLVGCSTRELTRFEAATPDKWVPVAVAKFVEHVLKERARYRHLGWTPEHPTQTEITV